MNRTRAMLRACLTTLGTLVRRGIVTILGLAVVGAGIAMLVLPGPGWLAIFAGLALLSTEYKWARRTLGAARRRFAQATKTIRSRGAGKR